MEVILRQAFDSLGHPGDLVKVSAGFGRNFLLPRGIAVEATEGNKRRIAQEKARLEAAEAERRQGAEQYATKLEQVSLTFSARVGEEGKLFGSVTAADIAHQPRASSDRLARSDQGTRRLPRADQAPRGREARDQGVGDQGLKIAEAR